MNRDSYDEMLKAVQAFHDKHDFKNTGGEELTYRVALMSEELGEIAEAVTKGKDKETLAEEVAAQDGHEGEAAVAVVGRLGPRAAGDEEPPVVPRAHQGFARAQGEGHGVGGPGVDAVPAGDPVVVPGGVDPDQVLGGELRQRARTAPDQGGILRQLLDAGQAGPGGGLVGADDQRLQPRLPVERL